MTSNPETIQKTAINFLHERHLKYVSIGNASFHEKGTKYSIHDFDYWVVPYVEMVFQEEDAFVYINDASQQVMHILTNHGYIQAQEQPSAVLERDDEDDWDDL